MTGTSGRQRVPTDCLGRYEVVVPSPEVAAQFGTFAREALRTMKAHDDQVRTLGALRDLLLPKLFSGEVRVKDAKPAMAARA